MLDRVVRAMRAFLSRRRAERELDEELQFHLEMEIEAHRARGLSTDEARRAALCSLGGVQQTREAVRDQRATWFDQVAVDFRHAARGLAKAPAFTAAIVATLAIGIGGSTVVFSVVEALLLRPLPYRDPDRLAALSLPVIRWFNYEEIRQENRSFTGTAAFAERAANLVVNGQPERGRIAAVSDNLFDVLGVRPLVGRGFHEGDPKTGQDRAALLSHAFSQARFGSPGVAIGRTFVVDHDVYTVIGVLPPEFRTPRELAPGRESVFERTVQAFVIASPADGPNNYDVTGRWEGTHVVGRLKDSVAFAQAQAEIGRLANRSNLRGFRPASAADESWALMTLRQSVSGEFQTPLAVMSLAVGLLLAAACANVANLLLERMERRRGELALRAALGASARQLAGSVLSETALIVLAGWTAGCLVSWGGVRVIQVYGASALSNLASVRVNVLVLGFAASLSMLAAIPICAAQMVRLRRSGIGRSIHAHAIEPRVAGRLSLPALLVVDQMVLSVILVVVGTLLARDMASLMSVDRGFETKNVFSADTGLDHVKYFGTSERFFASLLDGLSAIPGVEEAAAAGIPPGRSEYGGTMVQADGGRPEFVEGNDVSEDYFSILSIPLRAGRVFNREDARRDRPTAVVVNEAYALAHWGSTDAAVGKQLAFPNPMGHPAAPAEVVGVVGNSREIGAALTWTPRVYTSFRGRFFAERMTVLVKSRAGAAAVAATLSAAVKQLDPEQPFSRVLSLERTVSARYARQRLTLVMMAVFATLTLLLAAVGIHGVVSYAVTLRRREIGIRRAFGATGTSVVRLFVVRATGLILLGLVVGLPAGVALRWIAVVEWVGSAQSDWLTCLGGVGIVAVTGITAALVPAWRATRLDAMDVLRCE